MYGELNVSPEVAKETNKKGSFQFVHPWQRLLIVFAGPLFNFLLTIILIAGIYIFFVGFAGRHFNL